MVKIDHKPLAMMGKLQNRGGGTSYEAVHEVLDNDPTSVHTYSVGTDRPSVGLRHLKQRRRNL